MKKLILYLLFLPVLAIGQMLTQDESLVAFYPFNGNANDESGYENNAEVYGAVLTTDKHGNENSAYEFDGSSSYISIPNSESLQSPTTELTQVAWINIYSWSLVAAEFGPILMKSNSSGNSFQYRMSVGPSGVNTAIGNWENAVTIMDTLVFEEWYMIASSLKNDTVRQYVNGVFIGEGVLGGMMYADEFPLEIGRDVPGGMEFFHGKIDDIYIYNRALDSTEINNLYLGISGTQEFNSSSGIKIISFPNPFTAAITIEYTLSKPSTVQLFIYDFLGRLVDKKELNQGQGKQRFVWNAEGLPAGVYSCILKTDDGMQMDKLIKH